MAKYLEDRDLYYQLVISKGRGKLTRQAQEMLILIANNTIRKKERNYNAWFNCSWKVGITTQIR